MLISCLALLFCQAEARNRESGDLTRTAQQGQVKAVLDPQPLGIPYERYFVVDRHGRKLFCYLSKVPKKAVGKTLPIILTIGGSGAQSLFMKVGDRIGGGFQNMLLQASKGQCRVLCVEKPGVKFLEQIERPGSAIGSSEEFRREHTLDRWTDANVDALRACLSLPNIDTARVMVLGHSEGADVAAFVAAAMKEVTHVAPLSGGGPTQLFGLCELRARALPGDQPGDADKRRDAFYQEWDKVLADPQSIDAMWMGHPHRRWSTFLSRSPVEALCRSKANVYLAHGTEDQSSPVTDFDLTKAELRARGRNVVAERITGADHGYSPANQPQGGPPVEFDALLTRVVTWFLKK